MNQKKIYGRFLLFVMLLLGSGCEEKELEPFYKDGTKPGKVAVSEVINSNGGATVVYTVPQDEDLSYVIATYELNGKTQTARATAYNRKITLEGFDVNFGEEKAYDVSLCCVDKGENRGDPVVVKVQPKVSPVHKIWKTLSITEDWGGARFKWTNEDENSVVLSLIAEDSLAELRPFDWLTTTLKDGAKTLRGFDTLETRFAGVFRDRFDNYSDTLHVTFKPLFEEEFPLDANSQLILSDNSPHEKWGGRYKDMFDGLIGSYNVLKGPAPFIFSTDLGALAKISRFNLRSRVTDRNKPDHYYRQGNPYRFRFYGAAELPEDNGSLDGWVLMGTYEIKPPSGAEVNQGPYSDEDKKFVDDGFNCEVSIDMPKVRYVRVAVDETFGRTNYMYASGFKVFGQIDKQ